MQVSRKQVVAAYQEAFASPAGIIVLGHLTHRFGYTRGTTLVSGDPQATAFNEGQRAVLVEIGRLLDTQLASLEDEVQKPVGEG